ncbi:MAG: hypothetical protein KJ050_15610 [Candidatus Omnitrophica bacterium]|nr:hypothetical protein [Candidatus Omnitrophota bacterium]
MKRTFNYTNRKSIHRKNIEITVHGEDGNYRFDATLNLDDYDLPADAFVFVEASFQQQFMRFSFGSVGLVKPPEDRNLTKFSSGGVVYFRVKVVAMDGEIGFLLAEADKLKLTLDNSDQSQNSLLVVKQDENLEEEVWQLDLNENDPVLKMNKSLDDWKSIVKSPEFSSFVLPSILRTILRHVIIHEECADITDESSWHSEWLRFAISLPGTDKDIPHSQDPDYEEKIEEWIDSAVRSFCKKNSFLSKFRNSRNGNES